MSNSQFDNVVRIRITFSKQEMTRIESAASQRGISVPQFIILAAVKESQK